MLQRPLLHPSGLEEGVEIALLQPDHATHLVGRQKALVDHPIQGARHHPQPLGRLGRAQPPDRIAHRRQVTTSLSVSRVIGYPFDVRADTAPRPRGVVQQGSADHAEKREGDDVERHQGRGTGDHGRRRSCFRRARPLRRSTPLPTARAALGGFLVAVSALGIFATASRAAAGPTTRFVVARADLPVGTRLTADDLRTLPMELPTTLARGRAFRSAQALVGATTVGPVREGELVQAGDVVRKRSGADELELSFAVDAARAVAGSLGAGDRIDVLATFGSGGSAYTVVVVRQALVLDAERSGNTLDRGRQLVTVALRSTDEALALTHAVNAGDVTVVRATGSSVSGPVGQTYEAPSAREAPARSDG